MKFRQTQAIAAPSYDVPWKTIYVHATASENAYPVVSIQYSSIASSFQASFFLTRQEGGHQNFRRKAVEFQQFPCIERTIRMKRLQGRWLL